MMSPMERYLKDPVFHHLVDSFVAALEAAETTPTEIREAAMVAQMVYENRHPRPIPISEDELESWFRWYNPKDDDQHRR